MSVKMAAFLPSQSSPCVEINQVSQLGEQFNEGIPQKPQLASNAVYHRTKQYFVQTRWPSFREVIFNDTQIV